MIFRIAALLAAAIALGGMADEAAAQNAFPNRPIRMVVPNVAGGVNDVVGRIFAESMTATLGRQVVVDNRTGAGSTIGADAVAKSPADGYTILVNGPAHGVIRALYKQSPVDPVRDFVPVALLTRLPFVLAVHPSLPAQDVAGFIRHLKATDGKVAFGTTGVGSGAHLFGELFRKLAGVEYTHVPYRGTPPALNDLLNGQIGFMLDAQNLLAPHVQAGTLRALAVTTQARSALLPAVPTFAEAGVAGYDAASWQGMYAPVATPADIVARLNEAVVAALAAPAVRMRLAEIGIEGFPDNSPAALARYLDEEIAKWTPIIAATGATPG